MHTPQSVQKEKSQSKEEKLMENEATVIEEVDESGSGTIFSLPEFYLYIIAQAVLNGGYFAGVLYVSPFSQRAFSLSPVVAASMITLMGASELVFRLISCCSRSFIFSSGYRLEFCRTGRG